MLLKLQTITNDIGIPQHEVKGKSPFDTKRSYKEPNHRNLSDFEDTKHNVRDFSSSLVSAKKAF